MADAGCHHLSQAQRDALIKSGKEEGLSNRLIAERLGCDEKTVRNTLKSSAEKSAVEIPTTIVGFVMGKGGDFAVMLKANSFVPARSFKTLCDPSAVRTRLKAWPVPILGLHQCLP